MIAVRLLTRGEVGRYLTQFGCEIVEETNDDPYYRSSYWRTGWGFHFYVPEIGPDRLCPAHRLYEILADLEKRAAQVNYGKKAP
jgi:hypothetical protein